MHACCAAVGAPRGRLTRPTPAVLPPPGAALAAGQGCGSGCSAATWTASCRCWAAGAGWKASTCQSRRPGGPGPAAPARYENALQSRPCAAGRRTARHAALRGHTQQQHERARGAVACTACPRRLAAGASSTPASPLPPCATQVTHVAGRAALQRARCAAHMRRPATRHAHCCVSALRCVAGHMVPYVQPERTYALLQSFLYGTAPTTSPQAQL